MIFAFPALAQPHPDAGRRAGTILRQTRPARAAAMGGAIAAADQGIGAVWGNPAGLLEIDRSEVGLTRLQSFAEITSNMVAYGHRFGERHVAALSYASVDYGAIDGRDLSGRPTGRVEAGNHIAGISYALRLNEQVDVGVTTRIFNEELGRHSATTFVLDLGATMRTPIENLTIGAAAQNLGGSLEFVAEAHGLPRVLRAGASYLTWKERLQLAIDMVKPVDNRWTAAFGLEAQGAEFLILRAGGTMPRQGSFEFTTGLGIVFRGVTIDYAWIPKHDRIGDQHRVSLQAGF